MNWIETIKKIREAQENNRLVIFVGAGVSKNSGLPSWGQLVDSIAQKSVMISARCVPNEVPAKCQASAPLRKKNFYGFQNIFIKMITRNRKKNITISLPAG